MHKCVIIFGPPAVGKMTVGKVIAAKTGYKLLHNHMTIDLLLELFEWGSDSFRKLDTLFRFSIMEEVAAEQSSGFIFTFMWAFEGSDRSDNQQYIEKIEAIFARHNKETVFLELECNTTERVRRNTLPDRLEAKPSKRDTKVSQQRLLDSDKRYRLNSIEGEFTGKKHLKISSETHTAEEIADMAIKTLGL